MPVRLSDLRKSRAGAAGRVLAVACWVLCVIFAFPLGAQETVDYFPRREDLRHVAFVPAKQECENWGLAAVLQSVLEMQHLDLPQTTWITKLNGTDTCGPLPGPPAEVAKTISGDYRLDSGRMFHVEAVAEDTFVDPGRLVRAIQENRPFVLIWQHHAYMVIGLRYVEGIERESRIRRYDIQEMRLMDPFAGAEQSPTVFKKQADSLKEIDGIIEVVATNP